MQTHRLQCGVPLPQTCKSLKIDFNKITLQRSFLKKEKKKNLTILKWLVSSGIGREGQQRMTFHVRIRN